MYIYICIAILGMSQLLIAEVTFTPYEIRDSTGIVWRCRVGQSTPADTMIVHNDDCHAVNKPAQQEFRTWLNNRRGQLLQQAMQRAEVITHIQIIMQQPQMAQAMVERFLAIAQYATTSCDEQQPAQRLAQLTKLITTELVPPFDIPLHALQHRIAELLLDRKGVLQNGNRKKIDEAIAQFISAVAKELPPYMVHYLRQAGYDTTASHPSWYWAKCAAAPLDRIIAAHNNNVNNAMQEAFDNDPEFVTTAQLNNFIKQTGNSSTAVARAAAAQQTVENPRVKTTQQYALSPRALHTMHNAGCDVRQLCGEKCGQPIQHQLWSEASDAADALGIVHDMARCCKQVQEVVQSTAHLIEDAWQATEAKLVSHAASLLDHVGACNAYSMAVVRGVTAGVGDIVHLACHPIDTIAMLVAASAIAQFGKTGIHALYLVGTDQPDLALGLVSQAVGEIDIAMRAWIDYLQQATPDQLLEQTVRLCTQGAVLGTINTRLHTTVNRAIKNPIHTRTIQPTAIPVTTDIAALQYNAAGHIAKDVAYAHTKDLPKLSAAIAQRTQSSLTPAIRSRLIRWAPFDPDATIVDATEYYQKLPLEVGERRIIIPRYDVYSSTVIKYRCSLPPLVSSMPASYINWEHIIGVVEKRLKPEKLDWAGCHYGYKEMERYGVLRKIEIDPTKVIFGGGGDMKKKTFFPDHWSYDQLMHNIRQGYLEYINSGQVPTLAKNGNYEFNSTVGGIISRYCVSKKGVVVTVYPLT